MSNPANTDELIRCRNCGTPLAKKTGDAMRVRKPQGGEFVETLTKVVHTRGGVVSIDCSKCTGLVTPHYFVTLVADKVIG